MAQGGVPITQRRDGRRAGLGDAPQDRIHQSRPRPPAPAGPRQRARQGGGLVNRGAVGGAIRCDDLVGAQPEHVPDLGLDALGLVGNAVDEPVQQAAHLHGAEGEALGLLALTRVQARAGALGHERPVGVRALVHASQHPVGDPPRGRHLRALLARITRS